MPRKPEILQKILKLNREMRDLALEADWEAVRALEAERQPLIDDCFPLDLAAQEAVPVAEVLGEIIELDKSILSLASASRQKLSENLEKLKVGKQASNAYSVVGRGS